MSRVIAGILIGGMFCVGVAWGAETDAKMFHADPTLMGEVPSREFPGLVETFPVETQTGDGEVRFSTKTLISPYVEAVGGKKPTADELRLLPEEFGRNPLERYQLGAGIGVAVEDRANLTLGYRHHQPLSLLDNGRQPTTDGPRDDLRIFFDFKIPLD